MASTRDRRPDDELPDGVYERVVSNALEGSLARSRADRRAVEVVALDDAATHVLARSVDEALRIVLRSVPGVDERVALTNDLLRRIQAAGAGVLTSDETTLRPEVLLSVTSPVMGQPGVVPRRPDTSLLRSELLVNAERRSVVGELLSEIDSADEIDLLCSFIKWSGFVKFREALARHCRDRGRALRVLTTTYLGATDARAVRELHELGARVRVSYDGDTTRLHAKAWLFHRRSGFHTAYVGSSNLSAAALTDGLEWNVRVTAADAPQIVERFGAVFETYWDSEEAGFERYDADADARLREALERAGRRDRGADTTPLTLDVQPWSFQREILDQLAAARAHGRVRNLVVAATGTGKTVIAALDYRRLRAAGTVDSVLFVAHREEILKQGREVFRHTLRSHGFGELFVGGSGPRAGRHVFASIQSLSREGALDALAPDAFDLVIVDEVHHAAAPTYRALLERLRPKLLLGLTATPERADGLDLAQHFDSPFAAELRVWDAIDRQILCPFLYFGVSDGTDLSAVRWTRGRYDQSDLSRTLIGADKIWVGKVVAAVDHYVTDRTRMRALAFCVDVAHAEFVAGRLRATGLRAEALTSRSSDAARQTAVDRLRGGGPDRLQVLCTVDLFNEGVDIPEVDTILMLRPTESATVFLQQLGRGLRRAEGKDSLLVLDFIGTPSERFRFDLRYRALLGVTRPGLVECLESGFGHLPAGCSVQLEETAMRAVLASVRRSLPSSRRKIVAALRELGPGATLASFLRDTGLALDEVYDRTSWSALRRDAGFPAATTGDDAEGAALDRVQYLIHADDDARLGAWERLCDVGERGPDEAGRRLQRMLFVLLYGLKPAADLDGCLALWSRHGVLRGEVRELVRLLAATSSLLPAAMAFPRDVPLVGHARYRSEEVMVAYDHRAKEGGFYVPQKGVFAISSAGHELLLVTLDKSQRHRTPHLQYEDYALSPTEFHWQSQSGTRRDSTQGRRHVEHDREGVTPVLLVRERAKDDRGLAVPFRLVGPARCVRAHGERPITIVWKLAVAMPADLSRQARAAVA